MHKAAYKGKVFDRNGYAVHLLYEYRGHEYMITDGHNGYSESIKSQHCFEQSRIDQLIDNRSAGTGNNAGSFDESFWAFFE